MNKFLKEFKERGFFYQCTNENQLSELLDKILSILKVLVTAIIV